MFTRFLLAALMLTGISGCSKSSYAFEKRSPVSGSVTVADKPASGVIVRFHLTPGTAADEKATKLVETITDGDGAFRVSQNSPGDGMAPGKYTVTFFWPPGGDPETPASADQLKGRFLKQEASKVQIEVLPQTNSLPPFELK